MEKENKGWMRLYQIGSMRDWKGLAMYEVYTKYMRVHEGMDGVLVFWREVGGSIPNI